MRDQTGSLKCTSSEFRALRESACAAIASTALNKIPELCHLEGPRVHSKLTIQKVTIASKWSMLRTSWTTTSR